MFRFWTQQQNTRHCLRCLITLVASLWIAVVAPLLCSVHDGAHTHLLRGHHVAGQEAETHEHAHTQTTLDVHSHPQETGTPPQSHCEPVGDTQWALTMTISAPESIVLPQPLLTSSIVPGSGTALSYYPPLPDKPPRTV